MEISTFQDSKVESAWHGESCESHEGGSCWFWNSYPFLHMTESQRGSAITHGSLVRFIFHTFSLIPLTCSSVERLDGLALIQEIQEIQEIDSNICQVLDIPITTTHTHTHWACLQSLQESKNKRKEKLARGLVDVFVNQQLWLNGWGEGMPSWAVFTLKHPLIFLLSTTAQLSSHGPKTPPSHPEKYLHRSRRPPNLHQQKATNGYNQVSLGIWWWSHQRTRV